MTDSLPDPESFAAELAKSTRAHVARALQPLEQTVAKHDVRLDVCDSVLRTLEQKIDTIPAGKDGRDGINGKDGADGLSGKDGASGRDGASAFVIAKEAGFEGDERAWLESLRGKDGGPGAPGERGELGPAGADGAPGRDGIDGKDADPEVARVMAAEAVTELVEGFGKSLAARFAATDNA